MISQAGKASRLSRLQTLSGFWRRNVAHQEAAELARVLKALRKVAGNIGENVGLVEYEGMSDDSCGNIVIDPITLMGTYPVPPEKVDAVVGLVTHEALHRKHWSEYVWRLLERDFSLMRPHSLIGFQKLVHTGENIFVDSTVDGTILEVYLHRIRLHSMDVEGGMLAHQVRNIDILFRFWRTVASRYSKGLRVLSNYRKPLAILDELSENLYLVCGRYQGVAERCSARADLYRAAWGRLEETILSWKITDKRIYWTASPDKHQTCQCTHGTDAEKQGTVFSADLVRQIKTHLTAWSADITPLILSIVGHDCPDVIPISRWDYNIPSHPVLDYRSVARLRRLFYNYSDRIVLENRGLACGRLDKRRLYRAALSKNCFKQIDRIPSMDWNVTLLVDASGSMRGNKWRIVENTIATIHKSLIICGVYFKAWAYFEIDGICMISSLVKGSRLFSVPPCGQTASGQAIMAASFFMPQNLKKRLLIHITDGESNYGLDVQYGIQYCLKNSIVLVTLGCGCPDQEKMAGQYGRTIQFIRDFNQLPDALEYLLKWAFIYGGNERRIRQRLAKDAGYIVENKDLSYGKSIHARG
ncbi:MAG: VWA domain-containing protein [Deltaproteobacteria bacterium]|nr:VWA domain-containing protein [Deltaproteobacteria bacterium]